MGNKYLLTKVKGVNKLSPKGTRKNGGGGHTKKSYKESIRTKEPPKRKFYCTMAFQL
jgi:hypothetical protein